MLDSSGNLQALALALAVARYLPPVPQAPPPPPPWSSDYLTLGVTGTNGKSTTTSWLAAAITEPGAPPPVCITTLGFFEGHTSLPVPTHHDGFLAALRECHARGSRQAAIEFTSEALALGFARAWPVQIGVFTNLTHDHLDAHGSPEHYLASKAQLFVALPVGGAAVLNGCDASSALLAEVIPEGVRVLRYGVPSRGAAIAPLDVRASEVRIGWEGTTMTLVAGDPRKAEKLPRELHVRAIGEVFAENALAALLGAHAAGIPFDVAAARISAASPPRGRFEVIAERPWVVVDYAHSPDALARTVAAAKQICIAKLWVVFGAGGNRDRDKRAPMGEAARPADHVLLTTDNPRDEDPKVIAESIHQGLQGHGGVEVVLDRAEAIRRAVEGAAETDVVLIAGKGHETEQKIGREVRSFSDVEVALDAHRVRRSR